MVLMSETLKAFFRRLNQGFQIILVNKCQVSNVKPQNILLRKVADNVIFHKNKLRCEGINQMACNRFLTSYLHFYFIYEDQCFMGTHGVSARVPTEHGCGLMRKQA